MVKIHDRQILEQYYIKQVYLHSKIIKQMTVYIVGLIFYSIFVISGFSLAIDMKQIYYQFLISLM